MQPNDPLYSQQWYLRRLGDIGQIWDNFNGAGIRIGIYDSGIDWSHPDLIGRQDASLNITYKGVTYDGLPNKASTNNQNHGTAVAGLIGATGNNGVGMTGVAWGASMTSVNIFDSTNELFVNAEGARKGHLAALHQMINFDVVNKSSNSPPHYGEFSDFIDDLAEYRFAAENGREGRGTIIVQSAGNDNKDAGGTMYNASRYTITVAATKDDGFATQYSNYGSSVLVTAPGSQPASMLSTDWTGNSNGYDPNGDYTYTFDGTSASAPLVSGVVALMLDANPNLGWRDVQEILSLSATFTGGSNPAAWFDDFSNPHSWRLTGEIQAWNGGSQHFHPFYGYGMVNVNAAVQMAEAWSYFTPTAKTSANEVVYNSGNMIADLMLNDDGRTFFQIPVGKNVIVEHVDIRLDFSHAQPQQLKIYLYRPDGQIQMVGDLSSMEPGAVNRHTFTFGLDNLRGINSQGTWGLMILDTMQGNIGALHSVNFKVYGTDPATDDVYHFTDEFSEFMRLPQGERPRNQIMDVDGGSDWIDASATNWQNEIDLRAGTGKIGSVNVTISDIENVTGGSSRDFLFGTDGSNTLVGMDDDDWLDGRGGDDRLIGGRGNDFLFVDSLGDRVLEVTNQGYDTLYTTVNYELRRGDEIEVMQALNTAGATSLTLIGNSIGQKMSDHDLAADTLVGKGGNDTYTVRRADTVIIEDEDQGFDSLEAMTSYKLAKGVSIEKMFVETYISDAIDLTGNAFNQTIQGNNSSNRLDGGGGDDTLEGLYGDDTYIVDSKSDVVLEVDGQGFDTIILKSDLNYRLADGQSIEVVALGNADGKKALDLTGNALGQTLRGNQGNNVLDGMGGGDTLEGLGGNDIYIVHTMGDIIVEAANSGFDRVFSIGSYALAVANSIEYLAARDTKAVTSLNLYGNEFGQTIVGNNGVNILEGGDGDDTLIAGRGMDDLYGGGGKDTFVYTTAAQIGNSSQLSDLIYDFSQAEGDRIDLSGIDANVTAKGNQKFSFLETEPFTAKAGQLTVESDGVMLYVMGDINGDGESDFMLMLSSNLVLRAQDFIL